MIRTVQVTEIKFDFEDDDGILPEDEQQEVIDSVLGEIYEIEVDSDDDDELTYELLEEISNQTGWLIENLDFRHILR